MQKMSEKEAIEIIRNEGLDALEGGGYMEFCGKIQEPEDETECCNAFRLAIQALEEIQQYRAIGTVEDVTFYKMCHDEESYEYCGEYGIDTCGCKDRMEYLEKKIAEYDAIGTPDQCREAVERMKPKKPTCKEMPYSEEMGFCDELYCPACNNYVGYFTEGMSEPEQMECCNVCGQHIAKDWSE